MNKLAKLIDKLGKEDLIKIKRDLVSGNIDKLIAKKLSEIENIDEKFCPVCGGKITQDSFKLEFGSNYLRRKAYFDGVDCISYFITEKLKKNHEQ